MHPQNPERSSDAPAKKPRRIDTYTLLGLLAWIGLVLICLAPAARAERIKDLAQVGGVRSNPLVGYGLVVGLDGTGDRTSQAPFTVQSLKNMLGELGVNVPANVNPQLKNVAAVAIHADLPAFAKPGQKLDITVSSMGKSKSLRGGTLITTPLKGADGEIYALAQGNLLVGGAGASAGGSKVQINHLSAGRVPGGAQVERAVATPFALGETIDLGLNSSDFQTASRVTDAINRVMGAGVASAVDGRVVRLRAPATGGGGGWKSA